MTDPEMHPLELILRQCAEAVPHPWYPSAYAQATGMPRDDLDAHLDRLRLGGLIHIADWTQGLGQGYALTPAGRQVVDNPRLLARLRNGQLPVRGQGPRPPPQPTDRPATTWERGAAMRSVFLNPMTPGVTFALLFLNIAIFLAGLMLAYRINLTSQYLNGNAGEVLDQIGALSRRDVYVRHEWWRLLTACFVHIGWIHLAVNMYSLYAVGPLLERMWGHWRFLVLYLIAGLGGSCGMLLEDLWFQRPFGVGAGASGALWGVLASMATWIFLHRRVLPPALRSQWQGQLLVVLVLNLFITFSFPSISKGGHLGGGVVGLIAALPLDAVYYRRGSRRLVAVIALLAIPVVCILLVVRSFEASGSKPKEEQEIQTFNERYMPEITQAIKAAAGAYNHAKPLLEGEDGDVRTVLANLEEARGQLSNVSETLEKAGPFNAGRVREARKRGKDYVDEWSELLKRTEDYLRSGDNQADKKERVEGQESHVERARQQWQAILAGPD